MKTKEVKLLTQAETDQMKSLAQMLLDKHPHSVFVPYDLKFLKTIARWRGKCSEDQRPILTNIDNSFKDERLNNGKES